MIVREKFLSTAPEILDLFNFECLGFEEQRRSVDKFFVVTVRATNLLEARCMLTTSLHGHGCTFRKMLRMFELGPDRGWLQGTRNSWVKGNGNRQVPEIVDVRMYDRELYDRLRNAN